MTPLSLAEWRDFYVMIGTAAGVIVGATFVVASLAAGMKERRVGMRGFITPTAVHLGSVLIVSAILAAPALTNVALMVLLGLGGLAGGVYAIIVAARIWRMNLDLSDRVFYAILPIVAYVTIAFVALLQSRAADLALRVLAGTLVMLLIVGMRNAWDMASFMIMRNESEK